MTTPRDPQQDEKRRAALEHFWGQYRVWGETARKHQKSLSAWRLRVLLLGVAAAVLGAVSDPRALPWPEGWPTFGVSRAAFGVAGGVLLGVVAFLTRELLAPEREGRWLRSRAAAEAFKREGYLLAAGAPPYDATCSNAAAGFWRASATCRRSRSRRGRGLRGCRRARSPRTSTSRSGSATR
jgi:MFS family permease